MLFWYICTPENEGIPTMFPTGYDVWRNSKPPHHQLATIFSFGTSRVSAQGPGYKSIALGDDRVFTPRMDDISSIHWESQTIPPKSNMLNPKSWRSFGSDEFPFHFGIMFQIQIVRFQGIYKPLFATSQHPEWPIDPLSNESIWISVFPVASAVGSKKRGGEILLTCFTLHH